ncbi:PleD family two-component system response regulator [Bacteroidota bacterium]
MSDAQKILIVDDNSSHLLLLQSILLDEGYITETTKEPKSVVEYLEKKDYKLVLLDIMMPEMDGFEILEKIKTHEKLSKVNVIVISAKTDSWSIKYALDSGAIDYITKPINIFDVRNKVKSVMSKNE